eukprot:TRINITY_DN55026_c0_g1_i1.p1 TRINITY_DN55026_c0_g1~~TRINITY_DN55026_c0_g1_i1.p1  ORF type:complete len:190 (-),score=20.09 TRINITY_DN55026_c0_g1_i1:55-624(-)
MAGSRVRSFTEELVTKSRSLSSHDEMQTSEGVGLRSMESLNVTDLLQDYEANEESKLSLKHFFMGVLDCSLRWARGPQEFDIGNGLLLRRQSECTIDTKVVQCGEDISWWNQIDMPPIANHAYIQHIVTVCSAEQECVSNQAFISVRYLKQPMEQLGLDIQAMHSSGIQDDQLDSKLQEDCGHRWVEIQ